MYAKEISHELIEVDIICKDNIYPLCIRDALFYLGHGSSDSYFNQSSVSIYDIYYYKFHILMKLYQLQQTQLLDAITLPKSIKLNKGEEYSVTLSHFITPYNFYIRLVTYTYVNHSKVIYFNYYL